MLDGGPDMLQSGAHLQFKAGASALQTADIVQRVIAEGVQPVQFALIDALLPVDVEDALGDDRHLIDLVGVEGDDAQSHEVGDVVDALVFRTFQLQLPRERLLGLHPVLHGRDVDALFVQGMSQLLAGLVSQLL